jgi:hypothetical protein
VGIGHYIVRTTQITPRPTPIDTHLVKMQIANDFLFFFFFHFSNTQQHCAAEVIDENKNTRSKDSSTQSFSHERKKDRGLMPPLARPGGRLFCRELKPFYIAPTQNPNAGKPTPALSISRDRRVGIGIVAVVAVAVVMAVVTTAVVVVIRESKSKRRPAKHSPISAPELAQRSSCDPPATA